MPESAKKLGLGENFYFQHDNDPKHTAHIVQQWTAFCLPHFVQTPPQSPDINPIENLWFELESSDPRTWELEAPTIDPTSSWLLPRSTAIGWLNEEDTMRSRHLW